MLEFNKKKISIALFFTSLLLIIFISKIRIIDEITIDTQYTSTTYEKIAVFKLFENIYSYNNTLFLLFLLLINSILLFIFTDDIGLKNTFYKFKKKAVYGNTTKVVVVFICFFCAILLLSKGCKRNFFKLNKVSNDAINVDTIPVVADTTAIYDTTAVETPAAPATDTSYSNY